jgi:hypothetical protein
MKSFLEKGADLFLDNFDYNAGALISSCCLSVDTEVMIITLNPQAPQAATFCMSVFLS